MTMMMRGSPTRDGAVWAAARCGDGIGSRHHLARAALRSRLCAQAGRLGLPVASIEALTDEARVMRWSRGDLLFAPGERTDLVYFLNTGAMRLLLADRRGRHRTVKIAPPGTFLGFGSLVDEGEPTPFGAAAHVSSSVAIVSGSALRRVLSALPAERAIRFGEQRWALLRQMARERGELLGLSLQDRVLRTLEALARDFGRPESEWTRVDVPVTHADVAELAGGSRPATSRALVALRRAGRLAVRDGQLLLRSD